MNLSPPYEREFASALKALASVRWRGSSEREFAACWPAFGDRYVRGNSLLVVGRATNGFEGPFSLPDLVTHSGLVAADARKFAEANPLTWLHNTASYKRGGTTASHSAFWRVTQRIAQRPGVEPTGVEWWQTLAWSNLSKIAPFEKGNPPDALWKAHISAARGLLKREVEEMRPGVVLVIAPDELQSRFFDSPSRTSFDDGSGGRFVRGYSRWCDTIVIHAERPEYKPESEFAEAVERALRNAGY